MTVSTGAAITGRATATGLLAILLWSTSVGVTRNTTELLGPTGAPAVLFTVSALLLWPRRTPLREVPATYLWLGAVLFVAYQVCFVLALGLATSRNEAIEVGMVNYLWPSLTVVCATLAARERLNLSILLGLGLAFGGIVAAASPPEGLSLARFFVNAAGNPVSYGLALAAAVVWALYSTLTRALAQGKSALWFYMCLSAAAFWIMRLTRSDEPALAVSAPVLLLVAFASGSVALAYTFWNHGVAHGNIRLLAVVANATPLLSAFFASLLLQTPLPFTFWVGASLVVAGSALAAYGARRR